MLRAILLGIVQGLTEFLPVSSDGHLLVVPYLLGWSPPGLTVEVALHAGTLAAVLVYFARDLGRLALGFVGVGERGRDEVYFARRTVLLLALATVPAALAGLTLERLFEQTFLHPLWAAGFFLATALLMSSAELFQRRNPALTPSAAMARWQERAADQDAGSGYQLGAVVTWMDALAIGVAQVFALLPGASRSGSTIAAGMIRGLSRRDATRFTFLLSIPAVAGALVLRLPDLLAGDTGGFSAAEVAAGVIAAGLSGYWAIRWMLRHVVRRGLNGFALYLVVFAALIFLRATFAGS